MTHITLENHYHTTPIYDTRDECWKELTSYLEKHAKWNWVYLREPPQVYSEYDKDMQKMKHRGVVRFATIPIEHKDTIEFPSLGTI